MKTSETPPLFSYHYSVWLSGHCNIAYEIVRKNLTTGEEEIVQDFYNLTFMCFTGPWAVKRGLKKTEEQCQKLIDVMKEKERHLCHR